MTARRKKPADFVTLRWYRPRGGGVERLIITRREADALIESGFITPSAGRDGVYLLTEKAIGNALRFYARWGGGRGSKKDFAERDKSKDGQG